METLREKLETLTLALASIKNPDKPHRMAPELEEILRSLRALAGRRCNDAGFLMDSMRDFSATFVRFLDTLPLPLETKQTPEDTDAIRFAARTTAAHWERDGKEMEKLSKEIVSTAKKITAVVNNSSQNDAGAIVMTETNSKTVNDLIKVTRECSDIFRQISKFLLDLEKHLKERSTEEQMVATDEIQMVRERWNEFNKSLQSLDDDVFVSIATQLLKGPSLVKARTMGRLWGSKNTDSSTVPNSPTLLKAIQDASATGAEASDAPSTFPTQSQPSLVQSFLQWIISFFSSKKIS
ncbi:hypothetical protein AN958_05277 [Leucoagaricus sp. SymC.cos]|nr:hypothetical protein AN958_05277 [Leucoagaricus sp. SymC.cos]